MTPQGNRKKFFLGGWIVDFDFDLDFMRDHLSANCDL